MMIEEHIEHEAGDVDAWVCPCGNTPVAAGFFPCDKDGNEMEPVSGWEGLYVCDKCGRIIEQSTPQVVSRRLKTTQEGTNKTTRQIARSSDNTSS